MLFLRRSFTVEQTTRYFLGAYRYNPFELLKSSTGHIHITPVLLLLSQFSILGMAAGLLTGVFELLRVRLTALNSAINSRVMRKGLIVTPLLAGAVCSLLAATGRHQSLAQSMVLMNRMMSGEVVGTGVYASFVIERLIAVALCATSGLLGKYVT